MGTAAHPTRENRTITVDFRSEATYFQLLGDRKAFVECVLAFILSLGFQLTHKATCSGGGCLTRHAHYVRVRLGGLTIWRIQCTRCKAVCTILPHCALRYRSMHPDIARVRAEDRDPLSPRPPQVLRPARHFSSSRCRPDTHR